MHYFNVTNYKNNNHNIQNFLFYHVGCLKKEDHECITK